MKTQKMMVQQVVAIQNTNLVTVEFLRLKMNKTASVLSKYPVVMAMKGVGPSLGHCA